MLKYEDEELNDSGKSIHAASFQCLTVINDVVKELSLSDLVMFVQTYITKTQDNHRIAAITVFSSMIESMPRNLLSSYVSDGFLNFVEQLNSKELRIRVSISDLLNRVALNYPENFLEDNKGQTV